MARGDSSADDRARTLRSHILARIALEDRGYVSPCWTWQRWCSPKGYARAKLPPDYHTSKAVYRGAYEVWVGPIPDGMHIDHLCRNKSCVNPAHLEPVTVLENVRRAALARTCCKRGHEYTPENTRISSKGHRLCRICYPSPAFQRTSTRCRNGHIYGPDEPPGTRASTVHRCKVCRRASNARYNVRKRARMAAARRTRGGEALIEQRPGIARHSHHDDRRPTP